MNKNYKRIVAIVLILALMLSLTSCDFTKKKREAIFSRATKFSQAVIAANYQRIRRLTGSSLREEQDVFDNLQDYCNYSNSESEYEVRAEIITCVLDNITYEIDEESFEFSEHNTKCNLNISFSVCDFDLLTEDDTKDRTTLLSAVKTCEKESFVMTIPFEYVDDAWKVSSIDEVNELYESIMDSVMSIHFHPDLDTAIINETWEHSTNGRYITTEFLRFNMNFNIDVEAEDIEAITYEFLRDDEVFYNGSYEINNVADYSAYVLAEGTVFDDGTGCFLTGDYSLKLYNGEGNMFYETSCTVLYDNHEEPAPTEIPEEIEETSYDYNGLQSGYVRYFDRSTEFYANTSIAVFCNVATFSQVFSYSSGVGAVDFICESFNGYNEDVRYYWYYSETNQFEDAELVVEDVCEVNSYIGRSYYLFELIEGVSIDDIKDGSYWCVLANPDGTIIYQTGYVEVGNQ